MRINLPIFVVTFDYANNSFCILAYQTFANVYNENNLHGIVKNAELLISNPLKKAQLHPKKHNERFL